MQCVRTIIGISSATYFLLSLSCPCQTSAGWETTGSYPLAERQSNQTRTSHQIDKDLVFLYILGVQNLKHSEATFALFFFFLFLSLSDSFLLVAVSSIVATKCDATSLH